MDTATVSVELKPLEQAAPTARAWIVLAILCFVYILNFLDRQLLSILAKPIQDSLHISDGQLGLIGGLYFALFYCCISIPVGWMADKTNRVRVVSVACGLWSAATMACGFGHDFSAARRRADGRRSWRGRRRTAIVRDHLGLLPPGPARNRVRALQPGAAARTGARRRLRSFHRRRLQLAVCLHCLGLRGCRHGRTRGDDGSGSQTRRSLSGS